MIRIQTYRRATLFMQCQHTPKSSILLMFSKYIVERKKYEQLPMTDIWLDLLFVFGFRLENKRLSVSKLYWKLNYFLIGTFPLWLTGHPWWIYWLPEFFRYISPINQGWLHSRKKMFKRFSSLLETGKQKNPLNTAGGVTEYVKCLETGKKLNPFFEPKTLLTPGREGVTGFRKCLETGKRQNPLWCKNVTNRGHRTTF